MFAGILLSLTVGILWSFLGVFYQMTVRRNLSIFNISAVSTALAVIPLMISALRHYAAQPDHVFPPPVYLLFIIAAGGLNMGGSLLLQRSMMYGKSSITWAIGQSAMIVPFLTITLIFGERWILFRIIGTVLVLTGMVLVSRGSENHGSPHHAYGLLLAFLAFLILGAAQSMTSASSYFTYRDVCEMRPILLSLGSLIAITIGKIIVHDRSFRLDQASVLIIVLMTLQGAAALVIQFKALDILKEYGRNGIFFPIAIGTCIVGYTLWSVCFFHEKLPRFPIAGTGIILAGILMFCFQ